jgi:hypothetical protein
MPPTRVKPYKISKFVKLFNLIAKKIDGGAEYALAKVMLDPVDGIVLSQVTKNVRNLAISEIEPISLRGLKFADENVGNIGRDNGILKLSSGEYLLRDLNGAGKLLDDVVDEAEMQY